MLEIENEYDLILELQVMNYLAVINKGQVLRAQDLTILELLAKRYRIAIFRRLNHKEGSP